MASAAFVYGAVDEGPPRTNADRAHALAQDFACPVCAGQSVAESDVPVAREIRRQIAVWVDEGRGDGYIRDQLVAAYDADIDYTPAATGLTSLVWVLPVMAAAGIAAVLVMLLRPQTRLTSPPSPASTTSPARATSPARTTGATRTTSPSSPPGPGPDGRGADPPVSDSDRPDRSGFRAAPDRGAARPGWHAAAAWAVAIAVAAGAAGVLVARFSGSRGADGSITGDIRATTRQLIFEAQSTLAAGDISGAIERYDEALELQPSNAEALTYRGWLTSRSGDQAAAADYLDDAIAVDADYADARLFRAIVALDVGDADRAAAELAVFDSLDPPAFAESLIAEAGLRGRVAAAVNEAAVGRVLAARDDDGGASFADTGLSVDDVLAAAEGLAAQGRLLDGLRVIDWVLSDRPDDPAALAGRGWLISRTGDAELVDRGIELLDAALTADPAHPQALVYRAFARRRRADADRGDIAGARADLAAFDALADRPPRMVDLIEAYDLRRALSTDQEAE